MNMSDWNIGLCSWSLGNDLSLIERVKEETGISHIQLHVRSEMGKENTSFIESLLSGGWIVNSAMVSFEHEDYSTLQSIAATGGIVPIQYRQQGIKKVKDAIDINTFYGIEMLSFHFGMIESSDSQLIGQVREVADYAAENNVVLLMETGQETVEELQNFLLVLDHSWVGVNFDPANMILYSKGEPVSAVNKLSSWIKNIHIKDAVSSTDERLWGKEVAWGQGEVDSYGFFKALSDIGYKGDLCVERECGENRLEDIITAISSLRSF
ncbi:MAG: sugar phosphate isomerase/epimerase family protein [Sedimentisphaeraceae bacterium JB056]